MAFQRNKSAAYLRDRTWHAWRARHHGDLAATRLPPSMYADESRWLDFLDDGHLHRLDDSWGFEIGHLTAGQLAALHRFLEREYGRAKRPPRLPDWVRVRTGAVGSD